MNAKRQHGFTIIELTLAVVFVAILLLLVATVTIRIGNLYEKGTTIKSINQIGREVLDMMRRDISQAGSAVQFKQVGTGVNTTYRLCLDGVSYVANSGESLNNSTGTLLTNSTSGTPITFVRLVDNTATFCKEASPGVYETAIGVTEQPVELLANDGKALAVHAFNLEPLIQSSSQSLYRLTIVIGTNEPGTLDTDVRCRTGSAGADDANANFNYCSVAEFTTIIRSGGNDG